LPIATGNVLLQAIHNDYLAMQQNTINIDNVSARTKSTVLQHLCQNRPVAIEDIAHTMQLTPYQLTKALEPEEAGVGLVGGASGSAMLFGLDPGLLAMVAARMTPMGSILLPHDSTVRLLRSAKGVITAAGLNVGLQAGGGATISLGGLF